MVTVTVWGTPISSGGASSVIVTRRPSWSTTAWSGSTETVGRRARGRICRSTAGDAHGRDRGDGRQPSPRDRVRRCRGASRHPPIGPRPRCAWQRGRWRRNPGGSEPARRYGRLAARTSIPAFSRSRTMSPNDGCSSYERSFRFATRNRTSPPRSIRTTSAPCRFRILAVAVASLAATRTRIVDPNSTRPAAASWAAFSAAARSLEPAERRRPEPGRVRHRRSRSRAGAACPGSRPGSWDRSRTTRPVPLRPPRRRRRHSRPARRSRSSGPTSRTRHRPPTGTSRRPRRARASSPGRPGTSPSPGHRRRRRPGCRRRPRPAGASPARSSWRSRTGPSRCPPWPRRPRRPARRRAARRR